MMSMPCSVMQLSGWNCTPCRVPRGEGTPPGEISAPQQCYPDAHDLVLRAAVAASSQEALDGK